MMTRITNLIIVFMLFGQASGQELLSTHHNEVDDQGRQQGEWIVYDQKGNIKYEGRFKDGKPTGEFRYYYPEGNIRAVTRNYEQGKIVYAETFYLNGLVMARGKYIDQKKDSVWQFFSGDDGGYLSSEEIYEKTKREGVWKTYFPSGVIAEEVTYKDDLKNGPWVQYFTDGMVGAEGTFVEHELQGLFRVYYTTGKVNISGNYKDSMKDGIWMYFTEIEEAERKEVYREGVRVSKEIFIEQK